MTYYDNLRASIISILDLYKSGFKRLFWPFFYYNLWVAVVGLILVLIGGFVAGAFYVQHSFDLQHMFTEWILRSLNYIGKYLQFLPFFCMITAVFPALFLFREMQRGFPHNRYRLQHLTTDADTQLRGRFMLMLIAGILIVVGFFYVQNSLLKSDQPYLLDFNGFREAPTILEQLMKYIFNVAVLLFVPVAAAFTFRSLKQAIDQRKNFSYYWRSLLVSGTLILVISFIHEGIYGYFREIFTELMIVVFDEDLTIIPLLIGLFAYLMLQAIVLIGIAGALAYPLYHAYNANLPDIPQHDLDPAPNSLEKP